MWETNWSGSLGPAAACEALTMLFHPLNSSHSREGIQNSPLITAAGGRVDIWQEAGYSSQLSMPGHQGLVLRVGVWPKPDQSQLPWNFSPWSLEGNILSQELTSLRCEPRRWVEAETRKGESPEASRDPDSTSHCSSNCPVSCLPKLGGAALLFNQLPFCLN